MKNTLQGFGAFMLIVTGVSIMIGGIVSFIIMDIDIFYFAFRMIFGIGTLFAIIMLIKNLIEEYEENNYKDAP